MNRRRNSWQPVSGEGYKTQNLAVFITATEKKVTLRSKEKQSTFIELNGFDAIGYCFYFHHPRHAGTSCQHCSVIGDRISQVKPPNTPKPGFFWTPSSRSSIQSFIVFFRINYK
jgi:hypothetical protein